MKRSSVWTYIVIYLGALLVVIVVSALIFLSFTGRALPVPFLSSPTPVPSPRSGSVSGSVRSVAKTTLQNGGFFYTIMGRFPTKPDYTGGVLRGEFILDGNPNDTRVPVIMTAKTGKITMGRAKGSFTGDVTWQLVPTDILRDSIKPNAPVELRIVYTTAPLDVSGRQIKQNLDALASGSWSFPAGFILIPAMVGVIE